MEQTLGQNILKNSLAVMFKIICSLSVLLFVFGFNSIANADECSVYKTVPQIKINIPDWDVDVTQPKQPMDLLHGNVVATLVNNYDIVADINSIEDGYCVGLKAVDATIGYTDFLVKIDNRHHPKTCSYKAILAHENKHIEAYLSVIDDYEKELYESLYSAANSIMPIFVKEQSDIYKTIDKLNNELQSHPNIILMMQKIHATEEINNKNIDQQEDYSELKKCLK